MEPFARKVPCVDVGLIYCIVIPKHIPIHHKETSMLGTMMMAHALEQSNAHGVIVYPTLELGGHNNIRGLRVKMWRASIETDPWARKMLRDSRLTTSKEKTRVKFLITTVAALVGKYPFTYEDILLAAKEKGLALCSYEFAPQFLLQYSDQCPAYTLGEFDPGGILVAMEPFAEGISPTIFELQQFSDGRPYLSTFQVKSIHSPHQKIAFVVP